MKMEFKNKLILLAKIEIHTSEVFKMLMTNVYCEKTTWISELFALESVCQVYFSMSFLQLCPRVLPLAGFMLL